MRIKRTDALRKPLPDLPVQIETVQGNLHIKTSAETWIIDLDNFMQMVETYLGGSPCQG
ncbi:MAG: hypothetical protein K9M94_14685 [Spirochaetia bacterium]|nr:hypothetical protein [Spirochaetia bacterium]